MGRKGLKSPAFRLLHLYDCDYKIYNIAHTALLLLVNTSKQSHRAPHLRFIIWKEDASLPAMFNLLCSSMNQQLFKKNFCNQSNHYENNGQFNASHHVSTTKSTLFMVNKDEWYTKEGRAKSMKNTLYVQRYGKRHLSSWSDVEQQKIQARSLSHCWVTRVWRHQAGRQAGRQAGS